MSDPIPAAEHRRWARTWLGEAGDALSESSAHAPHVQAAALMAIAHALLALAPEEAATDER